MRESRIPGIFRSPRAVAAIAALICAACKVPEATLGAGIEARGEYAEASRFRVLVTQGGISRVIDGASMRVHADAPGLFSAGREDITLRAGSPATVDVIVGTSSGSVTGRVAWTPQEDWQYGVTAVVDTIRPRGLCSQITQVTPLPAPLGATADTLFMIHAGLPKEAVC